MDNIRELARIVCAKLTVQFKVLELVPITKQFAANAVLFDIVPNLNGTNSFYFLDNLTWVSQAGSAAGGNPILNIYGGIVTGNTLSMAAPYIVGTLVVPSSRTFSGFCVRFEYNPNGCTSNFAQSILGNIYKINHGGI